MADRPRPPVDPYRVLGLEPGAPMAEVKRAYRRLAKANHPDSAGEAALPRFLAINQAYEQIRTGTPSTRAASGAARGAAAERGEPWRADPTRAQAARERARAGRAWGAGPGTARGGDRPAGGPGWATGSGTRARAGSGSGSGSRTGDSGRSTGTSSQGGARGSSSEGRRRASRKATLGSTSYDEAREHRDAAWSGASWYGPTTGEYWIINPREYADPRKHGPGYQQRARRGSAPGTGQPGSLADDGAVDRGSAGAGPAVEDAGPDSRAEQGHDDGPRGGAGTEASSGTATDDFQASHRTFSPGARTAGMHWAASAAEAPPPGEAPGANASGPADLPDWLGRSDDPIRRLGLALVAWPPIGLAAAAAIGAATGCSTYAAACDGAEPLLPWLAQAVILGLLLLLPGIARILLGGTLGLLVGLLPLTAFLVSVGGSGAPQAGPALVALLAGAWVAGVTWALVAIRRRARKASSGTMAR